MSLGPDAHRVFVFGSNLKGRHGKGAALHAVQNYGAIEGKGYGMQGRSYAIPTKGFNIETLHLRVVGRHIKYFINDVYYHIGVRPSIEFNVTQVGCGLAGFTKAEIAPLFRELERNDHVWFDRDWKEFLPHAKFWSAPI